MPQMTGQIGIRELRDNLTATIRRIRAGDITPGVPLDESLRHYPVTGSMTASEALEEDRAEP